MDESLVESVFDEGLTSDGFSPPPAVKAKPKARAAPKAAPKALIKKTAITKAAPKKTQTTLKQKAVQAAPRKRAKPDTEDEDSGPDKVSLHDDSLLSMTPPSAKKQKKATASKKAGGRPLRELENEAIALDGASDSQPKKGSGATEQYQKLTQLEHIIKRPDTYIGSVERSEKQMWVYNSDLESMEMREVSFVPGLYKIFDEIVVNAADNKQRDKNMDTVKVTVDREKGEISVWNNGRGIPIEMHQKEKIYIPEMIFGHLLTSSNYDDDEQKVTGGRNGYGAKLCNVFSTKFILDTADSKTKKRYKQTWTNNMSHMGPAKIEDQKGDDFTKITFYPDFAKFKMDGMDDDFEALVKRRVYDLAGTSRGVKVFLNGEKIKVNSFKKYMEMYTKAIKRERGDEAANDSSDIITDSPEPRWEIGFAVSDGTFQQVSFVNSIATTSGGTHVNYIADQVCTKLMEIVKKETKKKGGALLKLNQIRNHIFLFVNCQIVNPAFTSQTKEQLTTKHSQFGSKCTVSDEFLKKIAKTEVITNILAFAQQKADQILKKSDGNRRNRMDNPKLTDANKAGTKDGHMCTLILTEGDSARSLALAGRSIVSPDLFGVFPLRGKLLNVRDASVDQISKNAEIQNIKNFLGLKHKTHYDDCKSLRYGHLMIMTDQDHDGSHIKGLLINFLQVQFPSLLKIPSFLIEFITPIVKVWKGDPKNPSKSKTFFTMPEYEEWRVDNKRGWEHKYYKGLGTSTAEDAQVYFHDLDQHLKEFHTMQENEADLIELAFSKKKADERKEWLRQFVPGTYLDHSIKGISYTNFVNKELILFSMADNMRSIPSVIDGLKPGQRKILWSCFMRNLKKDMKVVELAGLVSGLAAYQHGEASLQQTIVGLAQTFVGSNNINCLEPSGNFGSRLQGGTDAASARYIYTRLSPFARRVFHPLDDPLLTYNTDDEKRIEPKIYVPVVPMLLINGTDGIGTGWSSSIPNYHPEDIVKNLKLLMRGEPMEPMTPWFRDFKGKVTPMGQDRYRFSGIVEQTSDTEVQITELPIRMWTQTFKDRLVEILKAEKAPSWIKDYDDYNTHKDVHFTVRLEEKHMAIALSEGLEEKFKLTTSIATSNLVAFDAEGRITKYATVEDIMNEFYGVRIKFYEKRKSWQLEEMNKDLIKMSNQARFILEIIDGKLVVSKKRKADLVTELRQKGFKPIPKVSDAVKEGELAPIVENDEETEEDIESGANAYDYLLGMAIWSLTKERVEKLKKQIGDKELEIDALIKLSKEDLWNRDLDEFIEEWRFQLDDEAKRQKKIRGMGRRASSKLKIGAKGPATKKRKASEDASDDSDFVKPKGSKKAAAQKAVKPVGGLLSYLAPQEAKAQPAKPKQGISNKAMVQAAKAAKSAAPTKAAVIEQAKVEPANEDSAKEKPSEDDWMHIGGAADAARAAPIFAKAKTTALSRKPASKKMDSDSDMEGVEEVVRPSAASRKPRAAASKPIRYGTLDDSEDDNGDEYLFDVGKMVKGIGNSEAEASRPLFSASASLSRPGSSAGLAAKKAKPVVDSDADETDYTRLAPANARKGKGVTARTIISDEDSADDFGVVAPAPAPKTKAPTKPLVKAAPKPKVAPKPKPEDPAKKMPLSPAAKAYAAKQAKKAKVELDLESEDEVENVANEILSDDEEVVGRPRRRAAVEAKRGWGGSVEDEEEEDEDASEGFDDEEESE